MKFVLVGVSCGALFVRDYDNVSKLKDGTKELVDICRQVLILNGESVIYEYDRGVYEKKQRNKSGNQRSN